MKEKKFDENIENIYNALSEEQKTEYKNKQEKLSKNFLVVGIVLAVIVTAVLILCLVMCIYENEYYLLIFAVVIVVIVGILTFSIISTSLLGINGSDSVKVKMYIKRLENQKTAQKKDLAKGAVYNFPTENIKNVTILDSYTEVSDKLHAFLNYQEIIQTRMYKFKVDYKDGTSQVVTAAENSKQYSILMPLVNKNANEPQAIPTEKSSIEKIREYKQLLDDGIITQEEFDIKKKELL